MDSTSAGAVVFRTRDEGRSAGFRGRAPGEALVPVVLGLVVIAEGLRLVIYKDPYAFYDPIGPGFYLLALGVGLLISGGAHGLSRRRASREAGVPETDTVRWQLVGTVLALALYIFLVGLVGYLVATCVFYPLQLRISGVASWRRNFVLTAVIAGAYYALFVRLCGMSLPRGVLFA